MADFPAYAYTGTFCKNMEDAINQVKDHIASLDTGSGSNFVHTHIIMGNGYYQGACIYA